MQSATCTLEASIACLLFDTNVHDIAILVKALNAPGEKEYFLASAFSEFYCAPSASFTLRGLAVSGRRSAHRHDCCSQEWHLTWTICGSKASCLSTGSFVKGVFEKVGIEPQVRRLGKYKSAGDQLSRKDMSEPQREQLTALLDDIFDTFKQSVAASVGKSSDQVSVQLTQTWLVYSPGTMLRSEGMVFALLQVQDMLDAGFVDVAEYAEQGWLTGLKYEDEIITDLEKRTDSKPGELKSVIASPCVADIPVPLMMASHARSVPDYRAHWSL